MRLLDTLRRMYWTARLDGQGEASLLEKLRWWRLGFRPETAQMYQLPRAEMDQYLNDFAEQYGSLHLNPVRGPFNNKSIQYALLQAAGAVLPELVALVYRSHAVRHPLTPRAEPVELSQLEADLIADGGEFIVKGDRGGGGDKVSLVRAEGGALVEPNAGGSRPWHRDRWRREVMLVQRRCRQAEFWRSLYPDSLNTIRFITLWREGEPSPFIAAAAQRIGTARSAPVDNFGRGGVGAAIDLATGRLGRAVGRPRVADRLTHHPDTGAAIEGAVIPGWDEIRTEVLRLTGALPFNSFVGWDVYVDTDGRVGICEVNGARTGLSLVQLDRGLLADERVRRYYQEHNVV